MKEIIGDIWEFHKQGNWIVIPTNLELNSKSENIMGAGLAKQANDRIPGLAKLLGECLSCDCYTEVSVIPKWKIIALPTKYKWREKSDLELIKKGITGRYGLLGMAGVMASMKNGIYLPRLGCGLGGLDWEKEVKPELEKLLDDRFIIITMGL